MSTWKLPYAAWRVVTYSSILENEHGERIIVVGNGNDPPMMIQLSKDETIAYELPPA